GDWIAVAAATWRMPLAFADFSLFRHYAEQRILKLRNEIPLSKPIRDASPCFASRVLDPDRRLRISFGSENWASGKRNRSARRCSKMADAPRQRQLRGSIRMGSAGFQDLPDAESVCPLYAGATRAVRPDTRTLGCRRGEH